MARLQDNFKNRYGVGAVELVRAVNADYYELIKTLGLEKCIKEYVDKKNLPIEVNTSFGADLIEAMAEAGEKFPQNQKWQGDYKEEIRNLVVTPQNPNAPKSKGVLQDFKPIVGKDDLRPVMTGVYVSKEDKALVATDAHKLFIYKTDDFQKYADKIIDLKAYLGTGGDKISFIDGKYPNYQGVIPQQYDFQEKELSTYSFYNFCMSALAMKKLIAGDIFNVNIKHEESVYAFSPIVLGDIMTIALQKGYNKFTLEFQTPSRPWVLKFSEGSMGIVMPISYNQDAKGTIIYDLATIDGDFNAGGKTTKKVKSKPSPAPAPAPSPEPQKPSKPFPDIPYQKYSGSLNDVVYVPRRDIASIILKNGEELSNADIIDGIYRVKQKKALGGKMYANGGDIYQEPDDLQRAKDSAFRSIDWNKELREFAGSDYHKMTEREKQEMLSLLQRERRRGQSFQKGGTTGEVKRSVELLQTSPNAPKNMSGNWLFPADRNKNTVGVRLERGGNIKFLTGDAALRTGTPSNAIEKDILKRVNYDYLRPYFVGNFGWTTDGKKLADGYLFMLDDYDQKLVSDVKLKQNEFLFRYFNYNSAIGGFVPLIKINFEKGLLYFMKTQEFGDDTIDFETRGIKAQWVNIISDKFTLPFAKGAEHFYDGGIIDSNDRNFRKGKTIYNVIWDDKKNVQRKDFLDKQEARAFYNEIVTKPSTFIAQFSADTFNEYGHLKDHRSLGMYPKMGEGGMMAKGGNFSDNMKQKKAKLLAELKEVNDYLKRLENINTKEAYEESNNARNYRSILEAKLLHLEKYEDGGMMAQGGITKKEYVAKKVGKVMSEFKAGTLRSGSGAKVKKREQAIAIGLSEGRVGWKHKKKRFDAGGNIVVNKPQDNYYEIDYMIGDERAGYLHLYFDKNMAFSEGIEKLKAKGELYIDIVEVKKKYQNRGIAKILIKKAIEIAKEMGITLVTLRRESGMGCTVGQEHDTFLKKYYESFGFEDTWTEKDEEERGGEVSACAMHLILK